MPLSLKLFSRATGETRFVGAHVLDDERVTIGRSKECTLNLHDPERLLSRVQAELVRAADGYLLKVASSHTPVAVNGKDYPPGSEVMVRVGDTVTMDVHDIEIVSVAAVEPPKPAPAPVRETAPQPRRVIPLSAVKVDTPEALVPPARSKRGAVAGIGIGVVAVVTAAAFFLWPSAKTSDRDAAQKPAPAPVAAAPAPVAAPAVVAAALPTPAEPTPVPPTAAPKSSWDSAAHRTQLESAAGKARECIRSGNVACAEKNIAEAKKHVSHENKTDETVDVKTIESLTDSMELAKKLVRADAVRSDEYKRKAEEERKRATQTAAAPAPALAPAPAPGPSPARAAPPAVAAVTPAPAPARGAPAAPPPPPVAAVAPAPAAPVAPKDEVWVDNYTNSETATGLTKSFPKRDAAIPGNVIASRMGSEKDAKALWGPQGAKTIRYSGCNSPCGIGAKITVVIDFGHMVDTHEYVRIK